MQKWFLAVDGDDVGRKIEFFIVTNQIDMLSDFFNNFQSAMFWLSDKLKDEFDAKIIFNGGDSLLAILHLDKSRISQLDNLRVEFNHFSNATLSFGVGTNLRQAYFALKLAKASGKNRTEIFQEYIND